MNLHEGVHIPVDKFKHMLACIVAGNTRPLKRDKELANKIFEEGQKMRKEKERKEKCE